MEILNDRQDKGNGEARENALGQKLELTYPCSWSYKLIGYEKEAIQKAIHDVIIEREHNLTHSNASKTGKYVSMNLDLVIQNEDERDFIFRALKAHQNIKMVL